MPETYTLEQVKAAFVKMFKGTGEWWFCFNGPEAEQLEDVLSSWQEFEETLEEVTKCTIKQLTE